jgi:hypothetical protein
MVMVHIPTLKNMKKDEKLCWYIFIGSGTTKAQVDHDNHTPHWQPTNAKFNNKLLMRKKRGQNKKGGTTNADNHGNTLGVASA